MPRHVYATKSILDKATHMMDALEKKVAEQEDFQSKIKNQEVHYTNQQWKDNHAIDEAGNFSENLKRGVLSPDSIWDMLKRNKEIIQRIGI